MSSYPMKSEDKVMTYIAIGCWVLLAPIWLPFYLLGWLTMKIIKGV